MAPLVMLRSPKGVAQAVDPDKFDVAAAVKDGFQIIPEGPTRQITTDTSPDPYAGLTPDQRNRKVSADIGKDMAKTILPTAAGIGASLLVPEAAVGGRVLPWLLRAGARTLASGAAGGATDLALTHDPQHAAETGGMLALGQGAGELGSGLLAKMGESMALDATGASRAVRKEMPGVDRTIMRERIPVGRPGTTTGQDEIASRTARAADAVRNAVDAAGQAGKRFSTDDVLAQVDREIADLRASAHPDDAAEAARLQIRRDAFARRNPNGLTPRQLDDAVRRSQARAKPTYTKDANGTMVTVQSTPDEQIFHRLVAREGRSQLRTIKGVPEAKDRARELITMGKVYNSAEAAPPPRLSELGNPTHTVPVVARRSLLRPDNASRVGFGLTGAGAGMAMRSAPNTMLGLLQLLSGAAPADATNPNGGTR